MVRSLFAAFALILLGILLPSAARAQPRLPVCEGKTPPTIVVGCVWFTCTPAGWLAERHPCSGSYSVGGTISGLGADSIVTLSDGMSTVALTTNGPFTFPATQVSESTYTVTVLGQPSSQFCYVAQGTGKVLNVDITNINVICISKMQPLRGGWTPLTNLAPGDTGSMHLLSDGTVIIAGFSDSSSTSTTWWRLSPDSTGHYVNGTWTTLASAHCPHGSFASQLLNDGRFFVAGGEQGASQAPAGQFPGCATTSAVDAGVDTEIYDPVANTWSSPADTDPPASLIDPTAQGPCYFPGNQTLGDMISETLPDGSILMAPLSPKNKGDTLVYNPDASPAWAFAATLANGECNQSEASWVKLADGSILTVDPFWQGSERYIPSDTYPSDPEPAVWLADTSTGVSLYDTVVWEEGPAFLLPNGHAIFIGSAPNTAIYTPSGSYAPGIWTHGPCLPDPLNNNACGGANSLSANCNPTPTNNSCGGGAPDSPGAMMPDGKLLIELSATPYETQQGNTLTFNKPSGISFYEYDYSIGPIGSFTPVPSPAGMNTNVTTDGSNMLVLPDGTVLYSPNGGRGQLYVYQPTGLPAGLQGVGSAPGQPSITSVVKNQDGSFMLAGIGLNGISEGAAFGDDGQMSSNFPIVRLTDRNGDVHYARTYGWSSTGVAVPGPVTTSFKLPPDIPQALPETYLLEVVANGYASEPVVFTTGLTYTPPQFGGKRPLPASR